jgi:hypothetical protein
MAVGASRRCPARHMDSLLQEQTREAAAYRKETGQIATDEFERRAWERIREARQRREEERQRGRVRDAGRETDR